MKKFRFFHPTKTGGTSVTRTLQKSFKLTHNHKPLFTVPQLVGYDYTFATVRNPYGRVISMYNFFKKANKKSLDEFVNDLAEGRYENHLYYLPQWKYVEVGDSKVDDIIRMETYSKDWDRVIKKKLGVNEDVKHLNKTEKILETYLSKINRDKVYTHYKEDFKLLGYKK